jgi:nucleoside-diphosphate-sugar epimerase
VFAGEDVHTENSPMLLDDVKDERYHKTDEYALAKAREEKLLRESGYNNWTIIRPCITYSAPRFQFGCLEASTFIYRALQGQPCVIPSEMLDKRTTMMWGGDTAEMISRLILHDEAMGEDYNTVTSESHTWREVAEIYREEIGMEYEICSLDDYCRLCNPYQVRYGRMVNHFFDNAKILKATGMRQEDLTPLKKGLKNEMANLQNCGTIRPNIRINALMDSMLSVRTNLNCSWRERLEYESVRFPIIGEAMKIVRHLKRHI